MSAAPLVTTRTPWRWQLQNANLVNGAPLGSGLCRGGGAVGNDDGQRAGPISRTISRILQNAVNAQSSLAGVNLDEEASKLLQYQQQYQAGGQSSRSPPRLFNQILSIGA